MYGINEDTLQMRSIITKFYSTYSKEDYIKSSKNQDTLCNYKAQLERNECHGEWLN